MIKASIYKPITMLMVILTVVVFGLYTYSMMVVGPPSFTRAQTLKKSKPQLSSRLKNRWNSWTVSTTCSPSAWKTTALSSPCSTWA